jgi:hypothetical protein
MRVLTISEADDEGIEDGDPLLVVQVDGPMIRRLLTLVVDHLAAPTPSWRPSVTQLRPTGPAPHAPCAQNLRETREPLAADGDPSGGVRGCPEDSLDSPEETS